MIFCGPYNNPSSSRINTLRLDQLTATRLLAALVVVAFHFGQGIWPLDDGPLSSLLRAGPQAVTYFYVLSGFMMGTVHADLTWRDTPSYWLTRFARVYPLYLFGILASLWIVSPARNFDVLLNLTLLQAWFPGHALSVNAVGWSLSVEVFFYALFPLLIGVARRTPTALWLLGVLAFWAAGQFWSSFFYVHYYIEYPSRSHDFLFYFPIVHLTSFLLGMTAALLMTRGTLRLRPRTAIGALALSLMLVGAGLRDTEAISYWTGVHVFGETGLLSPIFAILVVSLCSVEARFLAARPLSLLGQASYAVYILQIPVFVWCQRWSSSLPQTGLFWLYLGVLIGTSCLVFAWIETPSRRWIRSGGVALAHLPTRLHRRDTRTRAPP